MTSVFDPTVVIAKDPVKGIMSLNSIAQVTQVTDILKDHEFVSSLKTILKKTLWRVVGLNTHGARYHNKNNIMLAFYTDPKDYSWDLIATRNETNTPGFRDRVLTSGIMRNNHLSGIYFGTPNEFDNGLPERMMLVCYSEEMSTQEFHDQLAASNKVMYIVGIRPSQPYNVLKCHMPIRDIANETYEKAKKRNSDVIYYGNIDQEFQCIDVLSNAVITNVTRLQDINRLA